MSDLFQGQKIDAVVLAAGKGTRMKSDLPKVLHKLADKTMLDHVLDTVGRVGIDHTVVVVGHEAQLVEDTCTRPGIDFVLQEPQLGTGHAVQVTIPKLRDGGYCVVLAGDVPLL
jgi:bifunctional UDP-N-acetylglucosamine pyrophosphorylase / glucosamine-1-phosphate N-acetyltransferase